MITTCNDIDKITKRDGGDGVSVGVGGDGDGVVVGGDGDDVSYTHIHTVHTRTIHAHTCTHPRTYTHTYSHTLLLCT
jgi:hypothetical protein